MESLKDIAERQQASGPRYYDDPEKEKLLRLLLELAEETCVLRDRLATANALGEQNLPCSPEDIDAYKITEEEAGCRLARHQAFFEELFRKLSG
jgi:hypothetical protein